MKIGFLDHGRRGRLFCCLLWLIATLGIARPAEAANTTIVQDVVYRADGTPAAGTLVISWPAFTAADNSAVAAGSMSVAIGAQGAINVSLVPNAGGTPDGTYYKVIYKLDNRPFQGTSQRRGHAGSVSAVRGQCHRSGAQRRRPAFLRIVTSFMREKIPNGSGGRC